MARPRSLTVAGAAQELAPGVDQIIRTRQTALVSRLSLAEDFDAGTWNLVADRKRGATTRQILTEGRVCRLLQINRRRHVILVAASLNYIKSGGSLSPNVLISNHIQ